MVTKSQIKDITKEILNLVNDVDRDSFYGIMGKLIQESGWKEKSMAQGCGNLVKEIAILVNGKMELLMVMESM